MLIDELDLEILSHKEVHFGSNWDVMLGYYAEEGVGTQPDFDLERILRLKEMDPMIPELIIDDIEEAKGVYLELRENNDHPLVDLIFSEEEEPTEVIANITKQGDRVIPALTDLITSDLFYNPLFPGYGRAPLLAAKCLAKMGKQETIPYLFEALGRESVFTEMSFVEALKAFGDHAKAFLIKRLTQKPYTKDNENAAHALATFETDPIMAKLYLSLLEESPPFAPYLIYGCEALISETDRALFKELAEKSEYKIDFDQVINSWNNN
ncbi:MAG: hypothetical protein SP1CHLAM54_13770 [Chlamydiia bacterium]|nr:hypothetical protein [Chlamydiia bacterium]MCH9616270.1 hypothetical protein [Chlamydiia bacterium]MCH9629744.1 hypothetical protein [Chlamydiia bacterium]